MTPEKQQIVIAEACGWWINESLLIWQHKTNDGAPPNYSFDLNAMHDAEKMLSRGVGYHQSGGFGLYKTALAEVCNEQHPIDATASQRAEAFLRTISKWEEAL